ncbi:MAG: S9 family peptidase [Weeksellaceae bacterium]|nr:S9 family peptidase [Weeksellaceae bacterium]
MKKAVGLLTIIIAMNLSAQTWPNAQPPKAAKKPFTRSLHNDNFSDPYYWMNAYFKKTADSSEIIAHLEAENAYTAAMMQDSEDLQDKLYHEMRNRIKEKDESVPFFKDNYYYYTRTEEGAQYFKFCRKKGSLDAPEEVLLDIDEMAEGHSYYSASGFSISPDHNWLAYGVDVVSRRQYRIYFKNLITGEIIDDNIANTTASVAWSNDNKTVFYTSQNPETLLTERIMRHSVGTPSTQDHEVYFEEDDTNYIGVFSTKNQQYLLIHSSSTTSSEVRYLDANQPMKEFKVFQPRIKDVLYDVTALEDRFLINTNLDALNFRIMETPLDRTEKENWTELIPHRADVLIEDVDEFKNFLVFSERYNGLARLVIYDRNTLQSRYVQFDEPTYLVYTTGNVDYFTENLRYVYNSMVTPATVYEENMRTAQKKVLKVQEVLGDFDRNNYVSERLFATAKDGTKIPLSVVYRKGIEKNGKNPVLLYGYGSYGNSMEATFSSTRLSLLDRGFIWVTAHIRGGEEMGRQWYEDGKMMKKKNTFQDFIDAGEYLIQENYTSNRHLYAMGGSAGGLLMGAVINMKPDLWNGVIAAVPFVDVVTTMMDASIPLTTNEYDEWGNPANPEHYTYMKSYSPYDNLREQRYPHLLVTTGLHDSQVQYFEPAKWVAKLRDVNQSNNVVLLKTEMDFGHGGASGRFDYLKEIALNYAFLLKLEQYPELKQ